MTEWWHVPTWQGRQLKPERWSALYAPMRWTRKPRVVLVDDIFADKWTYEERDRVFTVMALCPQHLFVLPTFFAFSAKKYLSVIYEEPHLQTVHRVCAAWPNNAPVPDGGITFPLSNLWLGTHIETQAEADQIVPELLATPAALRFVHVTPREVIRFDRITRRSRVDDWTYSDCAITGFRATKCGGSIRTKLDWLIVEGGADPMHPDHVRLLRDQCAGAGVPFNFAGWYASNRIVRRQFVNPENNTWLNGVEYNAFPKDR